MRRAPSEELLAFECGGQQWVWEVCLPLLQLDDDGKGVCVEGLEVGNKMTRAGEENSQKTINSISSRSSSNNNNKSAKVDLDFVEALLREVEGRGLPAPGPIEQRWTRASTACMSPAYTHAPGGPFAAFSWVGIIMYVSHPPEVSAI